MDKMPLRRLILENELRDALNRYEKISGILVKSVKVVRTELDKWYKKYDYNVVVEYGE